jgi:hypothetical protein
MRGMLAVFVAGFVLLGGQEARALGFCDDLKTIISAARVEFSELIGEALPSSPSPDIAIFLGTQALAGAGTCAIAQQSEAGRRWATSYTCAEAAPDTPEGLQTLAGEIASCVGVTTWVQLQQPAEQNGNMAAQFGLIRLTITHNGARGGLALGVEVFRDERGDVMGSTMRGDSIGPDGGRTCRARPIGEIAASIRRYSELPGAERFEDDNFLGYTNRTSEVAVAFVTRPVHPAHPAIIVRRITERDGSTFISAEGDFAGDCQAFKDLLRQTDQMNRSTRPQ